MASNADHVSKRDGHLGLAEARPAPTPRASKAKPVTRAADARYSEPSTVGWYDERKAFESAQGNPSPRQRLERGEQVDGKVDRVAPGGAHQEPGDASIAAAAPLT
jgi:hypothetical protein